MSKLPIFKPTDPVLAGLERQLSFDSSRITLQEKSGEHKNHIVLSLYALKLACEEGRISEEEKALLKFFIMKKKSDYPTSIRHKLSSFENVCLLCYCKLYTDRFYLFDLTNLDCYRKRM